VTDRSPAALPDFLHGLSAAEVADRAQRGLANRATLPSSRSLSAIVRANVFTRFNAILGTLLVVILAIRSYPDALFGVVLVVNSAIGIIQEWRAKRTLDRLSLLNAPSVTVIRGGQQALVNVEDVVQGDVVELGAGVQVIADGEVLAAEALEVDESLLTGESLPEAKTRGADVRSGSFVTAGRGWYRADQVGAEAYANKLAAEARQFSLVQSELRQGIDRILGWISWLIVPVATLLVLSQSRDGLTRDGIRGSVAGIGAMIPEGLVLLTSVAFAAAVIRLGRRNVLVSQLAAIEGLARVDVLCIDKTGTLTEPVLDVTALQLLVTSASGREGASSKQDLTQLAHDVLGALAWTDPQPNATMSALATEYASPGWEPTWRAAFSSARKFSGAGFVEGGDWVLGAPDVLLAAAGNQALAQRAAAAVDPPSREGLRVLLLARMDAPPPEGAPQEPPRTTPFAIVALQERIRSDAEDTLDLFRRQGVAVKVISGDDSRTVGAVARRLHIEGADSPVDARELPDEGDDLAAALEGGSVFGRVRPHQKQGMVTALQARGHTVAMTGDGVNDVLALKQADMGIAMGSGSAASRAVAPVVLLDSSFASLPPILAEGRRVIANVERVANLFLTKTVYATLLALAVGVAGVAFPFVPRHLTIVSSLTIGIPAFFLALAPNDRRYVPGFVGRVLRFALPTGAVAATATFAAYMLATDMADVSRIEARTVATVTLFLVALWVLAILARPASPARTALVASMGVAFAVVLAVPWLRDFFELELAGTLILAGAVGVAAMASVALELGWQISGWVTRTTRRSEKESPPHRPASERPRTRT
jgi:cation-transporting ATPase E